MLHHDEAHSSAHTAQFGAPRWHASCSAESMTWHARLDLDYSLRSDHATRLQFSHDGPLRVLRSLYPEGPGICHNVLVHPPGGLVGGDVLDMQVRVAEGAHALITTPGATRFYRSNGHQAVQRTRIRLDRGARLEWLPLEAIAYPACDAANEVHLDLAEGSQLMAWDITAFGLPHAGAPFDQGHFVQHIHWPGQFLERGIIDAQDTLLMNSPLGLAGQRCMGSLIFASGTALLRAQREALLEATHELLAAAPQDVIVGVTSPNPHMLVLRGLAPMVEPLMQCWQNVRSTWRKEGWDLPHTRPRIWAM